MFCFPKSFFLWSSSLEKDCSLPLYSTIFPVSSSFTSFMNTVSSGFVRPSYMRHVASFRLPLVSISNPAKDELFFSFWSESEYTLLSSILAVPSPEPRREDPLLEYAFLIDMSLNDGVAELTDPFPVVTEPVV